jgi:hypothetical protein
MSKMDMSTKLYEFRGLSTIQIEFKKSMSRVLDDPLSSKLELWGRG